MFTVNVFSLSLHWVGLVESQEQRKRWTGALQAPMLLTSCFCFPSFDAAVFDPVCIHTHQSNYWGHIIILFRSVRPSVFLYV